MVTRHVRSFIGPNAVLTAEHCVSAGVGSQVFLVPGRTAPGFPYTDDVYSNVGIPASKVIHGLFNEQRAFETKEQILAQTQDVAIVIFPTALAPATLALPQQRLKPHQVVVGTVVGFGFSTRAIANAPEKFDEKKRMGKVLVSLDEEWGQAMLSNRVSDADVAASARDPRQSVSDRKQLRRLTASGSLDADRRAGAASRQAGKRRWPRDYWGR